MWKLEQKTVVDLGIVFFFVLALFYQQIFLGRHFGNPAIFNDLFLLTHPTLEFTGKTLLSGRIPLWNSMWNGGMPHLAVPSSLVFYPTSWIFGVFSFHTAYKIVVIIHVLLAGAFAYFLGKQISKTRSAPLLCAFQFMSLSFIFGAIELGHLWSVQTLTWLPLSFLSIIHLLKKPTHEWGIAFTFSLAMMILGGNTQIFSYVIILLGLYTGFQLLLSRDEFVANPKTFTLGAVYIIGCVVLSLFLTMVLLLPSSEFLSESIRNGGLAYEAIPRHTKSNGYFFDILIQSRPTAFTLGKITLAMAIFSLISDNRKMVISLISVGLICIFYANMPQWFHDTIVSHLPVFKYQQGPIRIKIIVGVIYFLLVTIGFQALIENKDSWESTTRRLSLFLFIVAALIFIPVFVNPRVVLGAHLKLDLLLSSVYVLIALFIWKKPDNRKVSIPFLIVVLLCESLIRMDSISYFRFNLLLGVAVLIGMVLVSDRKTFARYMMPIFVALIACEVLFRLNSISYTMDLGDGGVHNDYKEFADNRGDNDRIIEFKSHRMIESGAVTVQEVHGVTMRNGDRSLSGHHRLLNFRFARLMNTLTGVPFFETNEKGQLMPTKSYDPGTFPMLIAIGGPDWITESSDRAFDLLNVRYLMTLDPPLIAPGEDEHYKEYKAGKYTVYENPDPMASVFILHDLIVCYSDEEALEHLESPDFDLRVTGTLTGYFESSKLSPSTAIETVTVVSTHSDYLEVEVDLSAPGIVVFSEIFYPGWKSSIDGRAFENVLCIDTALRGVFVDAGIHTIKLSYKSSTIRRGAIVSSVSVILFLAWTGWALFRHKKEDESSVSIV